MSSTPESTAGSMQPLVEAWAKSLNRRCWPLRVAKLSKVSPLAARAALPLSESWFFPTPWVNGLEVAPGKWEYCCFRLPGTPERVFVKICTTLISEWGAPNNSIALMNKIYGEETGHFSTTFHSELPLSALPATYGFEVFDPITDPEGPVDKSDPSWDGFGQWVNHKIGGAPYLRAVGPMISELHALLQGGYELLFQLSEPSSHISDPQRCDDFPGDEKEAYRDVNSWLFDQYDFSVLVHPRTMDTRYVWGG
jgi:hypothetical protein